MRNGPGVNVFAGGNEIFYPIAFNFLAIDPQASETHLDFVAGQSDDAFDVVSRIVLR